MNINLSLILPCFNESQNIHKLYQELIKINLENNFAEVIFVNNGSLDDTGIKIDEIIELLTKSNISNLNIVKLDLKENLGYGGGILAGLNIAKGEYIGWTHADLQTPLEDYIKLYKLVRDKKKILGKGKRTNNRGFDSIISKFHELCSSIILGFKMREVNAQPKIINKNDLYLFNNPPKKWTTLDTYFYFISLKDFALKNFPNILREPSFLV